MTADAHKVRSIFLAAVENHSPDQWSAYLDEACAADPQLRRRVEMLLRAHAESDSLLDNLASVPDATVDGPITGRPGTVIGPYKLIEQIGEGGMGLVYVAEQQQPIRRKVALKITKPGMDTRQVIARFEAERQALALMDHPNIARVLDGGTTDESSRHTPCAVADDGTRSVPATTGRPYFVMELVKGVTVTEYCDQNQVSVRERLELFVDVCQAVQHAHQKGIIHRDIKPSNVLVTSHDGKPVVKVIDFGVAKAIGQQLTDKTVYTQFAQMIGTPLYMSPEQAGESGLDIDTRSDIYSLGVLLYELLTGTTPFDKERLSQVGYDEMRRIIREEEPPKPSTRISTQGQAASTAAANRKSNMRKLSQLVRGELDWIVMKAMEKDRNRRYETASAFASDVQHYLNDEPVQACPPSTWYRLRKLARRNKAALVTAALIAFVMVLAVVGLTAGIIVVNSERQHTDEERQRTEAAYRQLSEEEQRTQQALIAEKAARGAEAKRRKQARRALDAQTSLVLEDLLSRQKVLTDAHRRFLRQALAAYLDFAADVGSDEETRVGVAQAYYRVGYIRHRLGEYQEAENAHREAIALGQKLVVDYPGTPQYRISLPTGTNGLGILLQDMNRWSEAEKAFRDTLALYQKLAADFPGETAHLYDQAITQSNLGQLLRVSGKPVQAETALRDAIASLKKLVDRSPTTPEYRYELAFSYRLLGDVLQFGPKSPEAEGAYQQAIDLQRKLADDYPRNPEYRSGLATIYNSLSLLLLSLNRPREALKAHPESLKLLKALAADFPAVPHYHKFLGNNLNTWGMVLVRCGLQKEAETAFRDALAIRKQLATDFPAVPEHQEDLGSAYHNLATLLKLTGRLQEAETAYRDALAIRTRLAADSPQLPDYQNYLAETMGNLARLLADREEFLKARQLLEDALVHHKRALKINPKHRDYRRSYHNNLLSLGALLLHLRDHRAAVSVAECLAGVGVEPATDAYYGASLLARCVSLTEQDDTLTQDKRKEITQAYAARAMKFLERAVQAGFRDRERILKDSGLTPLRTRDDFRKLLADLEANKKD
jgi:serine/threonine protein kinase/tetratricopeptide (TPR) repeat protein